MELPLGITVSQIARLCHQTNKAYCESIGDNSQLDWETAPQWQKDSAMMGVNYRLEHLGEPASAQHRAWAQAKYADGWQYGPVKDAEKREHPCLVSWEKLPAVQRRKDIIFTALVISMCTPLRVETDNG